MSIMLRVKVNPKTTQQIVRVRVLFFFLKHPYCARMFHYYFSRYSTQSNKSL